MPVDGGAAIQVTRDGGYEAQESWDGKKVYFTPGSRVGLKSVPAQGGEEKFENQAIRPRTWDVTQKGIVYLENDLVPAGHRGILLWNPDRGDTTQLGAIEMRRSMDTSRWFLSNADASLFLWSQIDRQESDLMFAQIVPIRPRSFQLAARVSF